MKKLIVILLIFALTLGLVACGGAENGESTAPSNNGASANNGESTTEPTSPKAVMVGFGAGDITPDWPCGLQGYGNEKTRISDGIKTYIYIHCVAVTDAEGETALIMSIDAGGGGFEKYIRPAIESELGIPKDNIILSAIHQHSTPSGGDKYVKLLEDKAVEAARQALEDRAPATMYFNRVETYAMNFVRNYICADGSIYGPNYGSAASGLVGYESEADPEMRLIKFVREGKKPIIMVNFQCHPHMGSSSSDTSIHGDWPAIMRERVAEELDAHCMYLSGAGGNMNSSSSIKADNVSTDWKDHGRRAANYVIKAEDSYVEASLGDVKTIKATNEYENDHSMDHLLPEATIIHSIRQQDISLAHAEVKKYPTLHSVYHASSVVGKAKAGPTRELTIGAISIGDAVFTYHPYEMFDTNGVELRNGTVGNENYLPEEQMENPFAMTFVCTLANGHLGYVPSMLGYTNGGYSTDITYVAPGTGERLVGDYLELLHQLKAGE